MMSQSTSGTFRMPNPEQTVVLTFFRSAQGERRACLLIESLRAFGGRLSDCQAWVFVPNPDEVSQAFASLAGVHLLPHTSEGVHAPYLFAEKVAACAQAEAMAGPEVHTLVWLNLDCLVVNPPLLFELGPAYEAAFRPVHIQNIGSRAAEPMDDFWKAIYQAAGLDEAPFTVNSYVDSQVLRPYFNTHCFSIQPSKGIFRAWQECFQHLVSDRAFQAGPCQDEAHRIFLHQAVLSALVAKHLQPDRIRILPPTYSYPLHFHQQIPPSNRFPDLNSLVCPVYEEAFRYPDILHGIEVHEPLKSWLRERL